MSDVHEPCRYCGRTIHAQGHQDYYTAHWFDHQNKSQRAAVNHFGGYVCSRECDVRACLQMLSSMPGAGPAKSLDSYCNKSVNDNWSRQ